MQGQMYEVKCEQKNLTQTKALAAEMSAIIILSFFGWDKLFIGHAALPSAGRSGASHMPTHADQHFDMYVFQHVDGPGLQRRCMALIRLTKMQNNETLARRKCPWRTEEQRDITIQNVDGNNLAFALFVVVFCIFHFNFMNTQPLWKM